jgi:formylglycine-generating enzyme
MRWIEPGEFLMGSPESEVDRRANEGPQHRVRITDGFWLADVRVAKRFGWR